MYTSRAHHVLSFYTDFLSGRLCVVMRLYRSSASMLSCYRSAPLLLHGSSELPTTVISSRCHLVSHCCSVCRHGGASSYL
ncbi:hypothetical protein NDU88_007005 [Pleurodeles waltl]|uniref:Uncharacterized protein n=1 Tax=Pleurodeles waltl TaxID=8319 RepID=A0AAV7RN51_PLEWA|nr:hypothetical protein NDU88_007005 [Pleurodeles waltl]